MPPTEVTAGRVLRRNWLWALCLRSGGIPAPGQGQGQGQRHLGKSWCSFCIFLMNKVQVQRGYLQIMCLTVMGEQNWGAEVWWGSVTGASHTALKRRMPWHISLAASGSEFILPMETLSVSPLSCPVSPQRCPLCTALRQWVPGGRGASAGFLAASVRCLIRHSLCSC